MDVKRSPKFNWASSHFRCKVELTIGTCGVRLVLRDFRMDLVCWHPFKLLIWWFVLVSCMSIGIITIGTGMLGTIFGIQVVMIKKNLS